MIDIALDFESFWDQEYSLKKLLNAEYVKDPRFESIGFGLKIPGHSARFVTGDYQYQHSILARIPWHETRLIAHNVRFDGSVLEWVFGFKPAKYLCTMVGSRPHFVPRTGSMSLEAISAHLGLPDKGHVAAQMSGKHRGDLTTIELADYGEYCTRDTENAWAIAQELFKVLPEDELDLIDLTLKKYLRPKLKLDGSKLVARIHELAAERTALFSGIESKYGVTKSMLASRPQFAEVLEFYGVEVPMKPAGKKAKKQVPTQAFAKDDPEFKALLSHSDPKIRELCAAKLVVSSSQEAARLERLLSLHNVMNGNLPVPLVYYGAHPGRFSGDESINLQNLQRVLKNDAGKVLKGHLRYCVTAPPGYVIIAADFSNIEARIVATLAGQRDLVQGFKDGEDVYASFASLIYGYPINKKDHPVERFVGKTCVAEGTLVLCDTGWKPIQDVTINDKLWDGVEWVCHLGLIDNGLRDVQQISNAWLTPDHCVWSGTQWLEAQSALLESDTLSQVLDTGVDCLRLLATLPVRAGGLGLCWSDALAADLNTSFASRTLKSSNLCDVQSVPVKLGEKNVGGYIATQCQIQNTDVDCSAAWPQQSPDVIAKQTVITYITGCAESQFVTNGDVTKPPSLCMCRRCQGGTTPHWKWTEQTPTTDIDPATSASQRAARIFKIKEKWQTSKQKMRVYDLLSAGSRNRFVIKTDDGALIVHNCILGLGYGMGWERFLARMRQDNIDMSEAMAKEIVWKYRERYFKIPELWGTLDDLARRFLTIRGSLHVWKCLTFLHERIILPNDMPIQYPDLALHPREGLYFRSRKFQALDDSLTPETGTRIWGGTFTENIAQALARIIATTAELKLAKLGLLVSLQVHDELVFVVPELLADQATKAINHVMIQPVDWLPELPIAVEIKRGRSYGECK